MKRSLVAALCGLTLIAACSTEPVSPPAAAPAPSAAPSRPPLVGTGGARPAPLRWHPCGERLQCTTASVPLDYRKPGGEHIDLALIMQPAADRAHVIGPLLINYGGPGTPGLSQLRKQGPKYPQPMRDRFDLVSFDPRGIGASTSLGCTGEPAEPSGAAGSPGFWNSAASTGRSCARSPLLAHMSSANTARDMDMIRQALRADKISYLGYSYGTYLGAVYANLFPAHVRAMTFDGTLDMVANSTGRPGQQGQPVDVRANVADAQQAQMEQFFRACAAIRAKCPFAAGGDPRQKWIDLVAATKRRNGMAELLAPVFRDLERGTPYWRTMAGTLQSDYGSASPAGAARAGVPPTGDPYVPTHSSTFLAVQCVDSDNPKQQQAYPPLAVSEDRRNPTFGKSAVYDMAQCVGWPATDADRYAGPWNAHLDSPVLIVNNRFDPATPLSNAEATAKELSRAQVLVVDGSGHTTLNVHSACAARAMAGYFVNLTMPRAGATCPPDYLPFG